MDKGLLMTDTIVFDAKPDAVPFNYRISYKMGQLCLILGMCSRKGSSFMKIQMIANAMNDEDEKKKLLKFVDSESYEMKTIRFDPAVNRVLRYAVADEMVEQLPSGSFILTEKGKLFVSKILEEKNLMSSEIEFLNRVSKKLTEKKISKLIEWWDSKNAKS